MLDFWASWCVPCIENIPTQKRFIKEYKNDPIEFISISLDKNAISWKQSLKRHNLQGFQLLAAKAFEEIIAVYFKVLWVPHYVIIDKNGTVLCGDAPQPLDPDFKKIIDLLLKK